MNTSLCYYKLITIYITNALTKYVDMQLHCYANRKHVAAQYLWNNIVPISIKWGIINTFNSSKTIFADYNYNIKLCEIKITFF